MAQIPVRAKRLPLLTQRFGCVGYDVIGASFFKQCSKRIIMKVRHYAVGATLLVAAATVSAQNYTGGGSTSNPAYRPPTTYAPPSSQPSWMSQYTRPHDHPLYPNTQLRQAPPAQSQQQIQNQANQALNAWKPTGACIAAGTIGAFSAGPVGLIGGCTAGALGITQLGNVRRLITPKPVY